MLKNYLLVAFRTLRRNKGYAFINVTGLALGIACCTLLALYVQDEWTHDRFHEQADRILRVTQSAATPNGDVTWRAGQPARLAPALVEAFPSVAQAVRLAGGDVRLEVEGDGAAAPERAEVAQIEVGALFTDPAFFEVFTFPLLHGDAGTALGTPDGVVLSATTARTLFGEADALGRALTVSVGDEVLAVRVTGVAADAPANSSVAFEVLLPFDAKKLELSPMLREHAWDRWDFPIAETFVLLRDGASATDLEAQLPAFAAQHAAPGDAAPPTGGETRVRVMGAALGALQLQPLTRVHADPAIRPLASKAPADPVYAYLLAGAALLVLLMASINFTTLALGRSAGRSREVGVRKVLGARRGQVRAQFWGEALLTSGAALAVGLGLAHLALPAFNDLAGKALAFDLVGEPLTALGLAATALVVGLVAGSYPAVVLSRFAPAAVLRGRSGLGERGRLTRALVVVQFALSIALVIGVLTMTAQLDRMQTDLGFNEAQVLRIAPPAGSAQPQLLARFREEAMRYEAVHEVAGAAFDFFGRGIEMPVQAGDTARVPTRMIPVSDTFIETLEIGLVEGRSFVDAPPAGSPRSGGPPSGGSMAGAPGAGAPGVLVNEALVRAMGWRTVEGKVLEPAPESMIGRAFGSMPVLGVVADFHAQPLREPIAPTVLLAGSSMIASGPLYVRIAPEGIPRTLDALRGAWAAAAPGQPFDYAFLDEVVADAYRAEQRWQTVVRWAAGFALLIACFGLVGLAALAAARRTQEIGVRKVLGASAASVVALLAWDFLKLVALAFTLAAPLAWIGARRWLDGFAYRIELGPGLFLLAGGLVLFVALAATGAQAFRAATVDPVRSLRHE